MAAYRPKSNSKTINKKRGSKHDQKSPTSKDIDIDLKTANTQLIELATYPGYTPHFPTPLPHGMDTLQQMRRVTSAQTKLSTKLEGYRKAWKQLFYSLSSQAIFLDYYWWFFLHRYQTNQLLTQDLLFSRIATNYVKMICEPVVEIKWKDSFFKMYPDVIAQCVFSAFIYAYPNSWNCFDEHFKAELCQYISLWQVGTKPSPSSWRKWELHLLEPPNLFKYPSKEEETSQMKGTNEGFDLDSLVKSAKVTKTEKNPSCQMKLSFVDVRKVLSGATEALVPLVRQSENQKDETHEGLVPSASEEKKIGIIIKQFENLERNSWSSKMETVTGSPSAAVSPPSSLGFDQKKENMHASNSSRETESVQAQSCKGEKPTKGDPKKMKSSEQTSLQEFSSSFKSNEHSSKAKTDTVGTQTAHSGKKVTGELKKMALSFKNRPKHESPTLKGPEFEHVMFNLYGHSPLVKHYMINMNLTHIKEKAIVVGRTEISEEPPHDAVCYREILAQSKATGKNNQALFHRLYKEQKHAMAAASKKRKAATQMHEQNVKLVLANKKEVQQLSNELSLHIAQPKMDYDRMAVAGAINKSLQRVKC